MEVVINREKVEGLLREKGMTKAEFASKMGIKRQNVDVLLESKKKDINTVIRMSEAVGIPFEEFIGLRERSEPQVSGIIRYRDAYHEIRSVGDIEDLLKMIRGN